MTRRLPFPEVRFGLLAPTYLGMLPSQRKALWPQGAATQYALPAKPCLPSVEHI